MICPNCGCECDENSMFCTKCGTKVNTFENDIAPTPVDKTYDETFTGITIESGKEDTGEISDEEFNNENTGKMESNVEEETDDFDDSYIAFAKHKYKSVEQPYSNKKGSHRKKLTKRNFFVVMAITVLLIVIAVFSTLAVKKTVMTKKFDRYYTSGEKFFDEKNYEYAKSQFKKFMK